ncbi:MAG TPA: hypothetical protein VFW47_15295 [Phenylobacterium sp.]|nr:hypothetical protein [Phenylobacterium sp.]
MTIHRHAVLAGLAATALLAAGSADAQSQAATSQIVRGVVTSARPNALTLKGRDGKPVTVALADSWTVAVMKPVAVDQIQPGSFIGTAEMPQKNGAGKSLEVHVFPPGVKMGEGHYAWDLKKGSMMTNGTVGKVVAGRRGQELDVAYSYGARHIVVPKNVPVVQITPGDRAMIKPGASVFLVAQRGPNGLITNSVSTGENGKAPPM